MVNGAECCAINRTGEGYEGTALTGVNGVIQISYFDNRNQNRKWRLK